jgi:hypothetical protein
LILAERSRFEDVNGSCAHCVHWMYVILFAWEHTGPRDWTYTSSVEDSWEGSCSASTGMCKIIQYCNFMAEITLVFMHSLRNVHEMKAYKAGHGCLSVRMIQP